MRIEIGIWLALPPVLRWALVGLGRTAATLTVGDLAALGVRVRRVPS
jgi:hypothetical protein